MTFLNSNVLSKAFSTGHSTPVKALLVPREMPQPPDTTLDYSDPTVCPYCKKPMSLSSIMTMSGNREPVYLCPDDRAVGVVPDAQ